MARPTWWGAHLLGSPPTPSVAGHHAIHPRAAPKTCVHRGVSGGGLSQKVLMSILHRQIVHPVVARREISSLYAQIVRQVNASSGDAAGVRATPRISRASRLYLGHQRARNGGLDLDRALGTLALRQPRLRALVVRDETARAVTARGRVAANYHPFWSARGSCPMLTMLPTASR
jgi:hypothetical protein